MLLTLGACTLLSFKPLYPCPGDEGGSFGTVTVGATHACAGPIGDGAVTCWGDGPETLPDGAWTSLSAGDGYTCGLADGALSCVGDLADAPFSGATAVDAGSTFACALDTTGAVTCWGDGAPALSGAFSRVSAGDAAACGLDAGSASLACAGDDPLVESPPDGAWAELDVGAGSGVVVATTGAATSWGELGVGPAATYEQVSVGDGVACGIVHDDQRSLRCWGDGPVLDFPDGVYATVSVGLDGQAACALAANGAVTCWGADGDARAEGP